MPVKNYKVIICEGGDQVGKADAILTFSEKMLDMNIPVTYSSFPIYATPFGTTIRLFLRNGVKELNLSPIRALKAQMAMYALNRLEFMDVLLSNPKSKNTLILLDRSPFSNAITIAYGLANMEGMKNYSSLKELIDYAFNLESFMIKKMNLTNCVVQLVSEKSWDNVRNETADIYENEDVQKAADQTYDMYADRIGKGWKQITTKTNIGWRDKTEIFNDINNFLEERVGKIEPQKENGMLRVRYEIGIEEVLKHIYKGEVLPEGIVSKYLEGLRSNNKDDMHKYGCIIGVEVGKTCRTIKFENKGVRLAAKKIVKEVPEVLDLLKYFISEDFPDKFVKAINE